MGRGAKDGNDHCVDKIESKKAVFFIEQVFRNQKVVREIRSGNGNGHNQSDEKQGLQIIIVLSSKEYNIP